LRPYRIPVISTEKKIKTYLSSGHSYVIYDETLGWSIKPGGRSKNGLYFADQYGVRAASSRSPVEQKPAEGILRIAIFGDSFTYGAGVLYENTWGYYLEQNLKAAGIDAEVLNLAVGGYGMDQAFLRWKKLGYTFSPDIVIFGFRRENIKRNLNLIRPIYYPRTGLPFSKPRFILKNGKLEIKNTPPVPPERLADVIRDISGWDLVKYEHWINEKDYEKNGGTRASLCHMLNLQFMK